MNSYSNGLTAYQIADHGLLYIYQASYHLAYALDYTVYHIIQCRIKTSTEEFEYDHLICPITRQTADNWMIL